MSSKQDGSPTASPRIVPHPHAPCALPSMMAFLLFMFSHVRDVQVLHACLLEHLWSPAENFVQSVPSFHLYLGTTGPTEVAFTYTPTRSCGLTLHVSSLGNAGWDEAQAQESTFLGSEMLRSGLSQIKMKRKPLPSTPNPAIGKLTNHAWLECMSKEPEEEPQLLSVQSPHTWLRGCLCVLHFQARPWALSGFGAMLVGFVSQEAVLVEVHHQELVKLHVLMPLQGRALAGPAEPLQVDAEALWQLQAEGREVLRRGRADKVHSPIWWATRTGGPTFPSFNCLTKVVLWCSTFPPFRVPFASICNRGTSCLQEPRSDSYDSYGSPRCRELSPQLKSVLTDSSSPGSTRNHGEKTGNATLKCELSEYSEALWREGWRYMAQQ